MKNRLRIFLLAVFAAWMLWIALRPAVATNNGAHAPANTPPPHALAVDVAVAVVSETLPAVLQRPVLGPVMRDPFVPVAPPTPTPVAAPPAPPVAEPPPQPPALNLRFVGRATSPDGHQTIFATFGESPMSLTAGQSLPNGYQIETITETAVELLYPPLNARARLDLPAPPKHEIR